MELLTFLKEVKGLSSKKFSLEWPEMLETTPHVRELTLPAGSVVWVRGDLDSKKLDEEKLGSQKDTLRYGVEKGWKVILCGHRNRPTEEDQKAFHSGDTTDPMLLFDPEIRAYLEKVTGKSFGYVRNWLSPDGTALTPDFYQAFSKMENGDVLLLENERMWEVLWSALWEAEDENSLVSLVGVYEKLGIELVEKVGVSAHVNDAASDAKNVNFSTVAILPFMKHAALGFHFKRDLERIKEARKAKLVCFSGAKLDKVKKMKKIIKRGHVDTVIIGGLISLPFVKALALRQGKSVTLGTVAEPEQEKRNRELYISPEIIAQADEIYQMIEDKGIQVNIVQPVDFKLDDGTVTEDHNIPAGRSAWDIGPKSIQRNHEAVEKYINAHFGNAADYPIFLNGFLGRMEISGFDEGTKAWSQDVKKLAEAGFKVIAGGGEGRQVYAGAEVIISGGTTIQGMGSADIPALTATWLFNHSSSAQA